METPEIYIPGGREIVELGGRVHYSQELLCHLVNLPTEEANRIVDEIEYANRPRRIIRERGYRRPQPND